MGLGYFVNDLGSQFTDLDVDPPGVDDGKMFELGQRKVVVDVIVVH